MNATELARLVTRMRQAQKKWFRGDKSSATLEASKALEREVDRACAAVLEPEPPLFAREGGDNPS
jgi:hypothetical protein